MCGIAGLANCGERQTLQRMTAVQAHRGPDGLGVHDFVSPAGEYFGLGARRLSILDLSDSAEMPMANADHSVWLVYNGEIYNFRELRQQLQAKGYSFRSTGDTEVLLHAYEEWGAECLNRLNGMFAFAVLDLREAQPKVFLARDPFGIKPLYYTINRGALAFASESKALLEVPGFERRISPGALNQFLTFLWVPEPGSLMQGISKLPGGHYAAFENGELKITKYWDLQFPKSGTVYPVPEQELPELLRAKFIEAVRRQTVSDRTLGAFLSSGLDSSSIVAALAGISDRPVKTYTVTFPREYRVGQKTMDDPAIARNTARHFGCDHHEIVMEPNLEELWPFLVWHLDDPTADPAILASYAVCEHAHSTATVLLSGVGGDELFAGYRKHYTHRFARMYQTVPSPLRKMLEQVVLAMPTLSGTRYQGSMRLLQKMARAASLGPKEAFLVSSTYLFEEQKKALCTDELRSRLTGGNGWDVHLQHFEHVHDADLVNQLLYVDSKTFMPSLNLNYSDKTSMAASIELRVPYLDLELAEFAATNISPEMKLKGTFPPTTKYIFRKAMESMLPAEVLRQPKAGFGAPVDRWLSKDLRPLLDDVLSDESLRSRGFFRPEQVAKLRRQTDTGSRDWSMQIWQIATLELWCRTFLDGGDRKFVEQTIASATMLNRSGVR